MRNAFAEEKITYIEDTGLINHFHAGIMFTLILPTSNSASSLRLIKIKRAFGREKDASF